MPDKPLSQFQNLFARGGSKRNKYGAKATAGYASKKEHNRHLQLIAMQRAGVISGLREQVPYTLIPAQYATDGNEKPRLLERPCRYIADFVYTDRDGNTVVEDTKGVRTKEYIIKRKLMLYVHGIIINEI